MKTDCTPFYARKLFFREIYTDCILLECYSDRFYRIDMMGSNKHSKTNKDKIHLKIKSK